MTTIVDPLGTPSIIYNKSGKTIRSIVANAGNTFADAVAVPHVTGNDILLVDASGGGGYGAISLDTSYDIGDVVTIWFNGGTDVYVYDGGGSLMGRAGTHSQYIKVSSAVWRQISP